MELMRSFLFQWNIYAADAAADASRALPARGFAFLEMTNDSEAEKAIQAPNGTALGGSKLTINEARPKLISNSGSNLQKREHRLNRF
jgi:RNA recognition motif-containing protein